MLDRFRYSTLQTGLVLFWAIWMTLVSLTNLFDVMVQWGVLPDGFTFASYNFDLIVTTVGKHGFAPVVAALLFGLAVAWEIATSVLLWRAWWAMRRGASGTAPEVTQAFVVSIGLWAAFLIMTEVFVAYDTAGTHKSTLIAQLATVLVLRSRTE